MWLVIQKEGDGKVLNVRSQEASPLVFGGERSINFWVTTVLVLIAELKCNNFLRVRLSVIKLSGTPSGPRFNEIPSRNGGHWAT